MQINGGIVVIFFLVHCIPRPTPYPRVKNVPLHIGLIHSFIESHMYVVFILANETVPTTAAV